MSRFKNRFSNRAGDRISDRLDNQGGPSNVMSASLKTGLIYYQTMEGNSTPSIIPGGITMNADVAMTYGTAYGRVSQGGLFNGSTSKISTSAPVSTTAGMDSSNDVTISSWIKFGTTSQLVSFFANGPINLSSGYGFIQGNAAANGAGNLVGILLPGVAYTAGPYTVADTTTWHHIVVTRTAGVWQMYVDTVAQYGSPFSNDPHGAPSASTTIGRDINSVIAAANCSIDEVGLWTRALSTAEITTLYNSGAGLTY